MGETADGMQRPHPFLTTIGFGGYVVASQSVGADTEISSPHFRIQIVFALFFGQAVVLKFSVTFFFYLKMD